MSNPDAKIKATHKITTTTTKIKEAIQIKQMFIGIVNKKNIFQSHNSSAALYSDSHYKWDYVIALAKQGPYFLRSKGEPIRPTKCLI